ncbi:Uncharacterised protein [uncultured archaeon]|nr:Uncharacterised protein [uncultured archaeon]
MTINQFTQVRAAWIEIDERYPDYSVSFEPTSGIKVELKPQEIRFVRRFQKQLERYNELCKRLTDDAK